MVGLEEKLAKIEELLEKSHRVIDIETSITESIKKHRREHLIEKLQREMNSLNQETGKTALQYLTNENNILIHSSQNLEGYISTPISDSTPVTMIIKSGHEMMNKIDTYTTRVTYIKEFRQRYQTLIEYIHNGELDELLKLPILEIFHMISGR